MIHTESADGRRVGARRANCVFDEGRAIHAHAQDKDEPMITIVSMNPRINFLMLDSTRSSSDAIQDAAQTPEPGMDGGAL